MMRPCLQPGCPNLTQHTRCDEHRRQRDRERDLRRGTAPERGYGPPWHRARRAILMHQPWCVDCGTEGTPGNPLSVDHIVPKSRGGTDDDDNLTTRCRRCNSRKGGGP